MAKKSRNAKTWALTGLLKRINQGEDPKLLREEAIQLSKNIDTDDIASAGNTLINEGYPDQVVRRLCATFVLMGLHKSNDVNRKSILPADHILQRIRAEHGIFRCYLADLNTAANIILDLACLTDVNSEFRYLSLSLGNLYVLKEHINREEDVIFPYLEKYGWMSLYKTVLGEHAKIKTDIDNLVLMITKFNDIEFDDFKVCLFKIIQQLYPLILEHFSYEEELLYPISLILIDDVMVWEAIKAICDDIGYCSSCSFWNQRSLKDV